MNMLKCMLTGEIGFGIGGAYWGFMIFNSPPQYFPFPFGYLKEAVILGAIGSMSLAFYSKDIKKIVRSALFGAIGFTIGFSIGYTIGYPLLMLSYIYLPLQIFGDKEELFFLKPGLYIGHLALDFVIVGAIGGFFYGLALKKNILSLTLHGAVGFGIGSLIGPIIGNLVEMASGSLLAAYVTTFLIIGMILGAFLGRSMYLAEKQTTNSKEER
ncbi:MAG: hypothetical protein EFT35_05425 [Methanophagales archaeon ANME-1-THS]|nr:MAG: hypothetical protein EFT35_05425 [Methanophagales archaeon ANME-1-THS]